MAAVRAVPARSLAAGNAQTWPSSTARSCGSTSTASGRTPSRRTTRRDGARPEIYAYGFRNPWRFAGAGRRPAALGQRRRLGPLRGNRPRQRWGNYGWPIREGTHCLDVAQPLTERPTARRPGPPASRSSIRSWSTRTRTSAWPSSAGTSIAVGHRGPARPVRLRRLQRRPGQQPGVPARVDAGRDARRRTADVGLATARRSAVAALESVRDRDGRGRCRRSVCPDEDATRSGRDAGEVLRRSRWAARSAGRDCPDGRTLVSRRVTQTRPRSPIHDHDHRVRQGPTGGCAGGRRHGARVRQALRLRAMDVLDRDGGRPARSGACSAASTLGRVHASGSGGLALLRRPGRPPTPSTSSPIAIDRDEPERLVAKGYSVPFGWEGPSRVAAGGRLGRCDRPSAIDRSLGRRGNLVSALEISVRPDLRGNGLSGIYARGHAREGRRSRVPQPCRPGQTQAPSTSTRTCRWWTMRPSAGADGLLRRSMAAGARAGRRDDRQGIGASDDDGRLGRAVAGMDGAAHSIRPVP